MPLELDIIPVELFNTRLTVLLPNTSLDITSVSVKALVTLSSRAQAVIVMCCYRHVRKNGRRRHLTVLLSSLSYDTFTIEVRIYGIICKLSSIRFVHESSFTTTSAMKFHRGAQLKGNVFYSSFCVLP